MLFVGKVFWSVGSQVELGPFCWGSLTSRENLSDGYRKQLLITFLKAHLLSKLMTSCKMMFIYEKGHSGKGSSEKGPDVCIEHK